MPHVGISAIWTLNAFNINACWINRAPRSVQRRGVASVLSLHRSAAVSPSRELMRKQPCTRWEFSPWRRRQHVFFHSSVRFWVSLHSSVQANFGLKGLECLPLLGSTVSCSATPLSLVVSWSCCINIKWQYHQGGSDESVRVEVNYWICKPPPYITTSSVPDSLF